MSNVQAIFRDGVFRPLKPVNLPEGEQVDLNYESKQQKTLEEWHKRVIALQKRIAAHTGVLPDSTADIAADRMR